MLYTPHFLTGAVLAKYFPKPEVFIPLALLSHVVLDLIPHHDFDLTPGMTLRDIIIGHNRKKRIMLFTALAIDLFFLVLAFLWFVFILDNPILLIAGGFFGILPDLLEQSVLFLGKKLPPIQDKFQFRVSAKYGFVSYPLVSLAALYFLAQIT